MPSSLFPSVAHRGAGLHTAFNVAKDRVTSGASIHGANAFVVVHDLYGIHFEKLGEHGYSGFGMFIRPGLLAVFAWLRANQVIRKCKNDPERKWAADLAAMI